MHFFQFAARRFAAVSAIAMLALAAGCSKPAITPAAGSTPAPTATSAASKLGDLSAFRSIAADVAATVDKGDLSAAKTRIRDLELAWDSAEAGLKPRAADDWHALDKSIDHALKTVRADSPKQADCKKVITELITSLDSMQSKT